MVLEWNQKGMLVFVYFPGFDLIFDLIYLDSNHSTHTHIHVLYMNMTWGESWMTPESIAAYFQGGPCVWRWRWWAARFGKYKYGELNKTTTNKKK